MATKSTTKKTAKKAVGRNEKDNLNDLLVMKLRTLLDVENQLVKALPKMAKKAEDPELAKGFEEHAEQTKLHEARVREALEGLDQKPQKIASAAIKGMIGEAEAGMKLVTGEAGTDAFMDAAARAVEEFEIASYESAIEWAEELGQEGVADLLKETLEEEKETKEKLTSLAAARLNVRVLEVSKGEQGE